MFVGNCGCCGGPCTTWISDNGQWTLLGRGSLNRNITPVLRGLLWDESEIWQQTFDNWHVNNLLFSYDNLTENDAWVLIAHAVHNEMNTIKANTNDYYNTHRWTILVSEKDSSGATNNRSLLAKVVIKDDSTGVVYVDEFRELPPNSPQCFTSKVEKGHVLPNQLSIYVYVTKNFMGIQNRADFVDPDTEAYITELYTINETIALEIASKTPYEWDRINNVDIENHEYEWLIGDSYGSSWAYSWSSWGGRGGKIAVLADLFGGPTRPDPVYDNADQKDQTRWTNFTNRYAQKLSLAQEVVAYTLEVYGEDSNEYKKAVTDLEDIERIIDWGNRKRQADTLLLFTLLPSIENWRKHFNEMLANCTETYFNNRGYNNFYVEKGFSQYDDNNRLARWTFERQYEKVSGEYSLTLDVFHRRREQIFNQNFVFYGREHVQRDEPLIPLRCLFSDDFRSSTLLGRFDIYVEAEFEGGGWDLVHNETGFTGSTQWWEQAFESGRLLESIYSKPNEPAWAYHAKYLNIGLYLDLASDVYTGKIRISILAGEGVDVRAALQCPRLGCVSAAEYGIVNTNNRNINVKSYIKSLKVTLEAQDYDLDFSQGYSIWKLSGNIFSSITSDVTYYFAPLQALYEIEKNADYERRYGRSVKYFGKVGEKSWNSKCRFTGSKFNGTFELVRRPDNPSVFEHVIDSFDKHQISNGPRITPDGKDCNYPNDPTRQYTNNRAIPTYNQNVIYAYDDPQVSQSILGNHCGIYVNAVAYWAINNEIVETLRPVFDADAFKFFGPSCLNHRIAPLILNSQAEYSISPLFDNYYYSSRGASGTVSELFDSLWANFGDWREAVCDSNSSLPTGAGYINIKGPSRSNTRLADHLKYAINTSSNPSGKFLGSIRFSSPDTYIEAYSFQYELCKPGNYFETYFQEGDTLLRRSYDLVSRLHLHEILYDSSPAPLRYSDTMGSYQNVRNAFYPAHFFRYDKSIVPRYFGPLLYDLDLNKCFAQDWIGYTTNYTLNGSLSPNILHFNDILYHEAQKISETGSFNADYDFRLVRGLWPLAATWGQVYNRYVNETGNSKITCKRVEIVTAD